MLEELLADAKRRMAKSVDATKHEFGSVRTGRASTALLDRISVDYYGTRTPLNQLASITVPDARLLVVTPYDKSAMREIERALMESDLGITPGNDGKVIRLPIPALTEERRKEMVKITRAKGEDARISIRNIRRHAKEALDKLQKDGDAGEDDVRRAEKELDDLTGKHVALVDELLKAKEAELLEV
jgi:ribosome recycling factor